MDFVSIIVGSSVVINVPLWWGMLIMGEAMHVWGAQGNMGKSLYLPLNFSLNQDVLKK